MRSGLTVLLAVVLSGCAGNAMPPVSSLSAAVSAGRDGSWILPEAKRDDLLYVTGYDDTIDIVDYPTGKLVGSFRPPMYSPGFLCADSNGDVFVPTSFISSRATIYEYAHSGRKPSATLIVPALYTGAVACSVNPRNGDLAVSLVDSVALFKRAGGRPKVIQTPGLIWDCTYSDTGNLFAIPFPSNGGNAFLYELNRSAHSFNTVTLNERLEGGSAQWIDGRLVVSGVHRGSRGPLEVYQIAISGSQGILSAPIDFDGQGDRRPGLVQFWVVNNKTFVSPEHPPRSGGILNFWHFPQGGEPTKTFSLKLEGLFGLTFSKAK